MHLTITRDTQDDHRTFAFLATEEGFSCDILEPPEFDEPGDEVVRRRVAPGTWVLGLDYSPKKGYAVYEYLRVPGRRDLQLHPGNVVQHSLGCQLPGDGRSTMLYGGITEDCVTNSRATFKRLMTHLGCPDYLELTTWDKVREFTLTHPEAAEHTVTVRDP